LNGDTLKLAECAAIGVDPKFQIERDVIGSKPQCHLYQIGSDVFFRRFNPTTILGQSIQCAFLDGMHLFEFLLRDFANTEKHCSRNSLIILHDCLPSDPYMSVRSPKDPRRSLSACPGYWTGDVWKMLPILNQWRKDLQVVVTDAPPTGLVLITNLDQKNTVIDDHYAEIVGAFANVDLANYGISRLHEECKIMPTDKLMSMEDLASRFWL
jgi:hypothetical protein